MATVDLSWTDNSDNEDEFRIYRSRTNSPSFPDDYIQINTVSSNTTSYNDTTAPKDETVYYAVTAYNPAGESNSTTNNIFTTVISTPTTPQNLTSTVSQDDIVLNWDAVNWNGEQGEYNILRGESSGSYIEIAAVQAGTTTYTDTGLEDGEQFFYTVTAENSAGTSSESNETSGITELPEPTNVQASLID